MAKIIPLYKQKPLHSATFPQEIDSNVANDFGMQIVIDFEEIFSELEQNLNLINYENYQMLNCLKTLKTRAKKTQKIANGIKSELFDQS